MDKKVFGCFRIVLTFWGLPTSEIEGLPTSEIEGLPTSEIEGLPTSEIEVLQQPLDEKGERKCDERRDVMTKCDERRYVMKWMDVCPDHLPLVGKGYLFYLHAPLRKSE